MHHEIKMESRPKGSDQDILDTLKCPGCSNVKSLKWKNTGGQIDRVVIRSHCEECGDDVNVVIPGGLMDFFKPH